MEKTTDFRTRIPLSLSGEGPWYRLDLPLDIQLKAMQANLADIRVFNATGQAQAYSLIQEKAQDQGKRILTNVKAFPLYPSTEIGSVTPHVRVQSDSRGTLVEVRQLNQQTAGAEKRTGWLLDTRAIKLPLQRLILDWSGEYDGFQRFTIEASDDLLQWQPWGEGQLARLSFDGDRIEQREIRLPGNSASYLRLLWTSSQSAPELISAQLESMETTSTPPALIWSLPVPGKLGNANEFQWQLPVGLAPERVKIQLANENSLVPVTLYGRRENNQPWHIVSKGLLYRLTKHGQKVIQDELPLDGQLLKQFKLVIDDRGGGVGDQAPALQYAVHTTQLVFLAQGAGPYTLALGNPSVSTAALPLTTLIPGYNPHRPESFGSVILQTPVESQISAEKTTSPAAVAGDLNWKKIGLYVVLLFGVLMLALMAFSLLRQKPGT